jgi:hypothetical protein
MPFSFLCGGFFIASALRVPSRGFGFVHFQIPVFTASKNTQAFANEILIDQTRDLSRIDLHNSFC